MNILDKVQKQEITKKLTNLFSQKPEIILAYLFGSVAEDKTHKYSDIDVAVYVNDLQKENEFDYKLNLIGELNDILQTDDIDLVILNNAPPTLINRIIRYGLLLKCVDEAFRRRYLIQTFKEYEDAQHLLKIQFEYLKKRLDRYVQR
jgi:hypothetical protein